MLNKRMVKVALAAFSVTALCGIAQAAPSVQLLQFEPTPVSPGVPEFNWTGPGGVYVDGPGSHLNGDGNLPVPAQLSPGLQVDTKLIVPAPAGSGELIDANGSHFYDADLRIFGPNGQPGLNDTGGFYFPNINQAVQTLSDGSFVLTATDGATVLLTGTFTSNTITIPLGGTSSGYQSSTVTYTGGVILAAALAANEGGPGSGSVSMVTPAPITVNIGAPVAGTGGFIDSATVNAFSADATGVLNTTLIPEPASLSLLSLGALGLFGRRQRRA